MLSNFNVPGVIRIIGIAVLGVLATFSVLFLILREGTSIKASDGKAFSTEEECVAYEVVLQKVKRLYTSKGNEAPSYEDIGLQVGFVNLLTEKGFQDVQTLMKYQDDFKKLVSLFESASTGS